MAKTIDPPGNERKHAEFWNWVRGASRFLVNRRTMMIAIRTLTLTVRIVEILKRLFGDF